MGTWLTCSSLPFPSHRPLILPPLSTSLSLSVRLSGSIEQEKVPESTNSSITVLSLANDFCGHYGEPYWWVFIYCRARSSLSNHLETCSRSGSTCPAHVHNQVSSRVCMWQLMPTHTASPDSLSGSIIITSQFVCIRALCYIAHALRYGVIVARLPA